MCYQAGRQAGRQMYRHSTTHPPTTTQIGFSKSDVVVATAVGSGIASLTCGIMGNLPFGLAPGTGLSAYLSYGLVLSGVLTRPQAMTVCFFSGTHETKRGW
jgi:adenine/guanine/hypoxanthine permease